MQSFFDKLMGRKPSSAKLAADRLRFVLVTDRSELTPEQLSNMQKEIIDVIKKYCRIVETDVDIKLDSRGRENFLVADIPLVNDKGKEDGKIAFSLQTSASEDDDKKSDKAKKDDKSKDK